MEDDHDDYGTVLKSYFGNVSSDASYLIAEQFIQKIVAESCVNNTISSYG